MGSSSDDRPYSRSITLTGIDCACVVGLEEWEQTRAQPLQVDVVMELPQSRHVSLLEETVDYTVIVKAIQFFCRHGHWLLIEDIAQGLMRWLLLPPHPSEGRTQIERAAVTIRKPEALDGAAIPQLTVRGEAADGQGSKAGQGGQSNGPGEAAADGGLLIATPCVTARRVVLEAGCSRIKPPRCCLFVLSGSVKLPGRTLDRAGIEGRTTRPLECHARETSVLLEIER